MYQIPAVICKSFFNSLKFSMNVHTMLNMKEIGLATKHAASDTVV